VICPACRSFNDPALTPSGVVPPVDWDPIRCIGCERILTIDHAVPGSLRLPVDDDWNAWQADPRLARILHRLAPDQGTRR
jgi:hypothetical protein